MSAIKLMATNQHWADRQAYVRICGAFVGVINDNVLVEELLPLMLMTVDDNVPNVRSELAKSLAKLQRRGIFAELPDVSAAVDALRNDPDQMSAGTASLPSVRIISSSPPVSGRLR